MNKLEEYRDEKAASYDNNTASMVEAAWMSQGYIAGFNAAMALDLPVRFARWQNAQRDETTGLLKMPYWTMSWVTLYKHWLENVFDPKEETP